MYISKRRHELRFIDRVGRLGKCLQGGTRRTRELPSYAEGIRIETGYAEVWARLARIWWTEISLTSHWEIVTAVLGTREFLYPSIVITSRVLGARNARTILRGHDFKEMEYREAESECRLYIRMVYNVDIEDGGRGCFWEIEFGIQVTKCRLYFPRKKRERSKG